MEWMKVPAATTENGLADLAPAQVGPSSDRCPRSRSPQLERSDGGKRGGLHRSRKRPPNVGDVNYAARHQGTAEAFSQTVNSRPGLVGLRKIWTALGAG